MDDPEFALIKAIAKGEREAFEHLVERYQKPLYNFICRYLGDRSAAEDLLQEVFLQIYRSAHRFEPKARVSSWVFKIARNLSLNEIKRRNRLKMVQEQALHNEREFVDETATESMMKHELEQELSALLGDLTDNQRAALLLRVKEGLSYPEIGEVLGLSVQSVESLIFRARQHLRQSIQKMRA